jgi:hypothetical protein
MFGCSDERLYSVGKTEWMGPKMTDTLLIFSPTLLKIYKHLLLD